MITQVNRLDFESQFPMIKTFEVESVLYLYDGKSGMLAEISLEEIDQIYNYYILGESDNMPDYLKCLLNDGVFLPGPLNGITPKKEELDQIIRCQIDENVPKTLMIEITEKCNLNCRYCFFSKDDGFNERKHSHNNMKETIAYKAIDYYYNKYVKAITKFSPESLLTWVSTVPTYG